MSAQAPGLAVLRRRLAAGEVTPLEVLERCLVRLGVAEAAGAFVAIDETGARRAAAQLRPDSTRPLLGIPVAVKDLIDVEGMPTAAGRSHSRIAKSDAEIVARLRAAGAVIVGKTRTDEIGLGALTPGARDPRDAARSVGGSSGGSAIAVAVGAVSLAVATDTAGSARIPAAACGVTGLTPSAGWVGSEGVVTLSPSCDRIGLIAHGPEDLEAAWHALTGVACAAWQGRAAVFGDDALGAVERERADAAVLAAGRLDPAPAVLTSPSPRAFAPARGVLIAAEAARLHDIQAAETPAVRAQLVAGGGYTDAALEAARSELGTLGTQLRAAVGNGVLVMPTISAPPPRWDELHDVSDHIRATDRLTRLCGPVNTSGLVAMSVPFGTDRMGHPLGVQIIAARESTLLAAALRLDRSR